MINYDLNLLDDFHKRLLTLINSIDMTVKEIAKKINVPVQTYFNFLERNI
jgi:predicted transcriptional regulator